MSDQQEVKCGCGTVIHPKRVEALKDTTAESDMLCIECAQASPVKKQTADFRYDGGSNGGERPRHW